ncbi:acriflavine sensitivity control acr-2 [Fusarium sporotrichioides]|uniref:Acriflavine sensitivity control acr-2 n=1 Tax=Fusarium sporotrichioides TaxID=5514 RepID=A0A395SDS3_FUSSP|nr:acriflavine sensitivity control acr-2 [Fusarium sporotrichioides]
MHNVAGCNDTVIAIILLAILDVFESGSGAWNLHLDGAKKMLQRQSVTGPLGGDRVVQALLNEALIFQILGSSLAKPGVLNSESTLPLIQPGDGSVPTPIGCPAAVLSVIETFALERRFNTVVASRIMGAKHLIDTLQYLRLYDVPAWAMEVSKTNLVVPYSDLVHLGAIWKLAAEIYASHILFHLTGDSSSLQPLLVDDLIGRYEFLQREDDALLKCLIWPTFIAGSASIDPKSRGWVSKTLERIWQIGHCANTKNAAVVLSTLWEKFDYVQCQAGSAQMSSEASGTSMSYQGYSWLDELSLLDGSWLFI